MLGWLDRFFTGVAGDIGSEISKAVHWALHALASVVFAVFRNVKNAWNYAVGAMAELHKALDDFGLSVLRWATWLWKVEIPRILAWAAKELALLAADLSKLRNWAIFELAKLALLVASTARAIEQWVVRDIYGPLKSYADRIWNDLVKWGYTSWTYITHPYMLAELLIMPLVDTAEKYAWDIAGKLGNFLLALISKNIPRLITLIEDIITAVL